MLYYTKSCTRLFLHCQSQYQLVAYWQHPSACAAGSLKLVPLGYSANKAVDWLNRLVRIWIRLSERGMVILCGERKRKASCSSCFHREEEAICMWPLSWMLTVGLYRHIKWPLDPCFKPMNSVYSILFISLRSCTPAEWHASEGLEQDSGSQARHLICKRPLTSTPSRESLRSALNVTLKVTWQQRRCTCQ